MHWFQDRGVKELCFTIGSDYKDKRKVNFIILSVSNSAQKIARKGISSQLKNLRMVLPREEREAVLSVEMS